MNYLSGKRPTFSRFAAVGTGQYKQTIISQCTHVARRAVVSRFWRWRGAGIFFIAPPMRCLCLCHVSFDDGSMRFHTLKHRLLIGFSPVIFVIAENSHLSLQRFVRWCTLS